MKKRISYCSDTVLSKGPSIANSMETRKSKKLKIPLERLQAAYITNLLDNQFNLSSQRALNYLTNVRGLTKQTLRKYGVGLGTYSFFESSLDDTLGINMGQDAKFITTDCITFPWMLKDSEIFEQEEIIPNDDRSLNIMNDIGEKVSVMKYKKNISSVYKNSPIVLDKKLGIEKIPVKNFRTCRIKARSLSNKAWQRLDPPGGCWGFFGWHTIPPDATEIVITEGEYDAMAVYQVSGRPSVSLPNGCRSLPVHILVLLEKFEKIYLWMDNDGPGIEGAEKFAKKIGIKKCFLVRPVMPLTTNTVNDDNNNVFYPPKDANDALLRGINMDKMIQQANVLPHDSILSFKELRDQVLNEIIHPHKFIGIQMRSLPNLNKIVKGFRRGELTVFSGPTGCGKASNNYI